MKAPVQRRSSAGWDPEIGSPYDRDPVYLERSLVDVRTSEASGLRFRAWQDALVRHEGLTAPQFAVLRVDRENYATIADTAESREAATRISQYLGAKSPGDKVVVAPLALCIDAFMTSEKSVAIVGGTALYRQPRDLMWDHEGQAAPKVFVLEKDARGFSKIVRASVDPSTVGPLGPRMRVVEAREMTVQESTWMGFETPILDKVRSIGHGSAREVPRY